MEQDNITLQYGMYRTPSMGHDGELSECVNLIPKAGELVNLQEPLPVTTYSEDMHIDVDVVLNTGETLLYIHKTTGTSEELHYITITGSDLRYFTLDNLERVTFGTATNVEKVISVGNILVVVTDNGVYRWFWKNDSYVSLGNHLPELPIQFGLQTEYLEALKTVTTGVHSDGNIVKQNILSVENGGSFTLGDTSQEVIQILTNGTMAALNPLLDEECKNKDLFGLPFFVVYAFQLFDETYVMRSSPVLMTPYTIPQIELTGYTTDDNDYIVKSLDLRVSLLSGKLDYAVLDQSYINALGNWKDVIKSVDIFVSAPLYFYDQSGDVTTFFHRDRHYEKCNVSRATISRYKYPTWTHSQVLDQSKYQRGYTNDYVAQYYNYDNYMPIGLSDSGREKSVQIRLSPKTAEDIEDTITRESVFFKIASIDIRNLTTTRTIVPIAKGTLAGLEGKTENDALSFDVHEHDIFLYDGALSYNNRLILYGGERVSGITNIDFNTLIPYTNKPDGTTLGHLNLYHAFNGGTLIRGMGQAHMSWPAIAIPYIYLPDSEITDINLYYTDGEHSSYTGHNMTFETKIHSFLPGAYKYFGYPDGNTYNTILDLLTSASAPTTTNVIPTFQESNKVYISESSNPLVLKLSDSVTLDVGSILGISSTTKALSQGQFGQFPLYAFTSDGIWALEISSNGSVSAKQPVSRDVCTNLASITQIGDAVVFVTNQGLKLIQGSDVVLLSEAIEGYNVSETSVDVSTPINTFIGRYVTDRTPLVITDTEQFVNQVQTAKIVYDYPHQLLHIFPEPSVQATSYKHYVYSLDTKQWSTQVLGIGQLITAVPGYPLSTMQFDNKLYQYQKLSTNTLRAGYALTRPLSLGDPLSKKALYDLRLIGQRTSQNVVRRVAVFVSNDNVNWYPLPSLKALSAKYYRFLVMSYMSDIDTLSGLSLAYEYRYNHKMRGDVKTGEN